MNESFDMFKLIMILLGSISTITWALVQYNISRFTRRMDHFSQLKDDHEKRITKVESAIDHNSEQDEQRDIHINKTFDRVENTVDEVRKDLKHLHNTIYEFIIKSKAQSQ